MELDDLEVVDDVVEVVEEDDVLDVNVPSDVLVVLVLVVDPAVTWTEMGCSSEPCE